MFGIKLLKFFSENVWNKKETRSIGGYNDRISRARRVGLKDTASESEIKKLELKRITKAPK